MEHPVSACQLSNLFDDWQKINIFLRQQKILSSNKIKEQSYMRHAVCLCVVCFAKIGVSKHWQTNTITNKQALLLQQDNQEEAKDMDKKVDNSKTKHLF